MEITPYSIDREDLVKGLAQLQFLIDENGNRIPPLDDSHLAEIISVFNQTETKKEKMLLICNKYRQNKNNKIKDSMVEVLTNPTTHEAVREILTDDFHTVVFYGSSQIKNEELDILENSCDNIECEFVRFE